MRETGRTLAWLETGIETRGALYLVLLDPETVGDAGTYSDPYQYPTGIEAVMVNGQVVIQHGEHTGALPGRILSL